MLGVVLYVSQSLVRWNTYMLGRLFYAGGILVLDETVTTTTHRRQRWARLLPLFPRSSDVIQHESPSKDHHEFYLPRLIAQGLSRPRVSITLSLVRRPSVSPPLHHRRGRGKAFPVARRASSPVGAYRGPRSPAQKGWCADCVALSVNFSMVAKISTAK